MGFINVLFWICIFIVFYTYIGYGVILFVLIKGKRIFSKNKLNLNIDFEPEVTLFIPAYNEKDYISQKINNSIELDYPPNKLTQIWVTDGSDDGTPEEISKHPSVTLLHQEERKGKIAAMNRGMKNVKTPIVIFTDANTILSKNAVREIVKRFSDPMVGCVSGEKKIKSNNEDNAAGSGEGLYWKYESALKEMDDELYSVVGAAGELFAIRTELFEEVESDTLLDDFMISLKIAKNGYKTAYCKNAWAMETASLNVNEELKRKVRIAAGGIQSILRLLPLLNIFRYGILSFQYISHRVIRWTITPLCLLLLLILNTILVLQQPHHIYQVIIILQLFFYIWALTGWIFRNKKIKFKGFFVPYYFLIMNLSVYLGFYRLLSKKQSVNWERAKRAAI